MAVENTDIFLGSGASLTVVPELDFFFKPQTTSTTSIQIETANAVQFQLVDNMYVGCLLDWYDNGVYTSTHRITANDHDTFTITPATASAVVTADDSFVLRRFAAPCPAPDSANDGSGRVRLNADNWIGLIESATFPNLEVEMKQLNLSLGGSRNFTHQYKGIETASGGNLNLVANQLTWLYFALGKCTQLSFAGGTNTGQHPTNYHTGTQAHGLYFHGTSSTSHIDEGPFIYRVNSVSGVDHIMPPLMIGDQTVADIDSMSYPIAATGQYATYKFEETENADLPSFSLEYTLSKLTGTNIYANDTDSDAEDLNFVRIARGNRVNTFTLTANENEEVKMTMDLNTAAVTPIPQTTAYEARGGQADNSGLFNFTAQPTHLEPFFFSDGTIEVYGTTFLKITNFTLTINNNLQDKRFVGVGDKGFKEGIPAQRTYEIAITALVTDDTLFTELLNQDENNNTAQSIKLVLTKDSGESLTLEFDDYFTSANTWTVPDDKGAITVEATLMPRTLTNCTLVSHWILQG
tara:strand:- start:18427 stop:19992 length:1566 start_codon:yes stop_codon:yes gene_type:complete